MYIHVLPYNTLPLLQSVHVCIYMYYHIIHYLYYRVSHGSISTVSLEEATQIWRGAIKYTDGRLLMYLLSNIIFIMYLYITIGSSYLTVILVLVQYACVFLVV